MAKQRHLDWVHRRTPRSWPGPAAPPWTPPAACGLSCCRFEILAWATIPMRLSSSSTAAGPAPASPPTTTSLWPTYCTAACSLSWRPAICGTIRPAAGPPTTKTWPSWITHTAGTRWRSCRPLAAAVWGRPLIRAGGHLWFFEWWILSIPLKILI